MAVLLAVLVGTGASAGSAKAAALEPCEKSDPKEPVVTLTGELSLEATSAHRKALKRSGLKQTLIKPANSFTGRPAFPVGSVTYAQQSRISLKGGFRLKRGKRSIVFRNLRVLATSGKAASLRAKVGGKELNLAQVKGGRHIFDSIEGTLTRYGNARLTPAASKLINRKLRTGKRRLKAGTSWGFFNLYSQYKVTDPAEDPTGEPPAIAPVKPEPGSAVTISETATIKWFVRESFIDYASSGVWPGDGIRADEGATGDPASGAKNLVYSFNFPFVSGWTVPASGGASENTLIKGQGRVGFRYCQNTINFTTSDPEIEIDGDDNSRAIFRVNGTDGTLFPNERAVLIKLIPSMAEGHNTVDNGDGTTTVTYEKIPGFIPVESTGIFAGFYPAYDPNFATLNPRPDRFGFVSVSYRFSNAD